MTYTESSELPKEDGYYWIKCKGMRSGEYRLIEEVCLIEMEGNEIHVWFALHDYYESANYKDPSYHDAFHENYELLAYCKIEKPV